VRESKNVSSPVRIGISFGGTKIMVGLFDPEHAEIIARSDRIEWRLSPLWQEATPLQSLMLLVADQIDQLLMKSGCTLLEVDRVGIAWPGPGKYSQGELEATFIPGCNTPQYIYPLLREALQQRCRTKADHLKFQSGLDVSVRASGEIYLPEGAFHVSAQSSQPGGIALNLATGIAGAVVQQGRVKTRWGHLGETYGQWGRYLFMNRSTLQWHWTPTQDGSIPPYDSLAEVRFTDWCGGPALTRRFRSRYYPPQAPAIYSTFLDVQYGRTDPIAEKTLLIRITQSAYFKDHPDYDKERSIAREFIRTVGNDVGRALNCICNALGRDQLGDYIVLTGSIGERFGLPPEDVKEEDLYLSAIKATFSSAAISIQRSSVGIDAELVGLVCP
jgi:hypothetical protein